MNAAETLYHQHRDVARGWARSWARRRGRWASVEELENAAEVGLWLAARRWNSTFGRPFMSFAWKWIRGAVKNAVRSARQIKQSTFDYLTRNGIPVPSVVSLDALMVLPEFDSVLAVEDVRVRRYALTMERRAYLDDLLMRIPEDDEQLIRQHFLCGRTFHAIGKERGVTASWVGQQMQGALERLRSAARRMGDGER